MWTPYGWIDMCDREEDVRRLKARLPVLRLASELIRPTVVSVLDMVLRDRDANLRIDEVTLPPGSSAGGREIQELKLGEISNALLVAYRESSGQWRYNPPGRMTAAEESVLILLGTPSEISAVCEHVGGTMLSKPTAEGA